MLYNGSTTGDQLTLFIRDCDLPETEEKREKVAAELETALFEVLAEHDIAADRATLIDGHTYSSVQATCPACGDPLRLIEPALDAENGAVASASCPCGWRGEAVYRLIDFREHLEGMSSFEAALEDNSSVRLGDIQPMYTPY